MKSTFLNMATSLHVGVFFKLFLQTNKVITGVKEFIYPRCHESNKIV